jgi:outer membrane lipoprotein carrier protein
MRIIILFLSLVLLPVFVLTGIALADEAPQGSTESITETIRKRSEEIEGFRTGFTQVLKAQGGDAQERRGSIVYKKPGKIRWETTSPEQELLIVGADTVWDYFPEEDTVYIYEVQDVLGSKTMLRFISGEAKLDEDFIVIEQGKDEGLPKLELIPKEPEPGLVKAYLWVDGESFLPARIRIIDFYGNANDLRFQKLELNPELPDALFSFTPPQGVDVQDNRAQ